MKDLIERYKITANLPSVMMNYCNKFNSKQIELIAEMIYELENSIESADVQPVNMFMSDRCIVCYRDVRKDTAYYDINGATVCEYCMGVQCKVNNPIKEQEG